MNGMTPSPSQTYFHACLGVTMAHLGSFAYKKLWQVILTQNLYNYKALFPSLSMVKIPHSNYFEGVLQLRNPTDAITAFIVETTVKDDRSGITKIKKIPGGFDYYFTCQKYLRILGYKLKKNFSGQFKLSSTLHTQTRGGERLYRITILFRQYTFKRGSIVTVDGDEYEVTEIKTNIQVKDVKSGKKVWFPPEKIKHTP
jgi:NMD protein affecting ribosome stability and mRNA decay